MTNTQDSNLEYHEGESQPSPGSGFVMSTPKCNPPSNDPLVFVVDDEPTIGEVVATMLQLEGYQTLLFHNPHDAYQALIKTKPPPVLLVTDFLMEGINGLELIEQCIQFCPSLKTMIISGSAGPEIFKNRHIKPDCFIRKPFTMENLVASAQALAPIPKK
jgi:DNA-binding NtrC family response regulator